MKKSVGTEDHPPKIILMSGTPGTGKTSITTQLANKFNWIMFNLGDFIISNNLYINEDKSRNTKIIDVEKASIYGALEVFKKIHELKDGSTSIQKNTPIIVDSHYADIIIDGMDLLNEKLDEMEPQYKNFIDKKTISQMFQDYTNKPLIYGIILRCDPKILMNRLKVRGYSSEKINENVQAEILNEATQNMLEVLDNKYIFEFDTTNATIEQVSDKIENLFHLGIEKISEFKIGKINWMRMLSEEDTLDSYFKDDLGVKHKLKYNENTDNFDQNDIQDDSEE